MSKGILHPSCGQRFPDSAMSSHCASCCQNFYGLGAFDDHLSRNEDGSYNHLTPNDGVDQWYLDEKQRWHHGPRMSDEQKQQLGWAA